MKTIPKCYDIMKGILVKITILYNENDQFYTVLHESICRIDYSKFWANFVRSIITVKTGKK